MADDYERCGPQDVRKRVRTQTLRVDDNGKRGRPRNQRSKIVILEGSPGSGKTAILDSITGDLARIVPFARFDFATIQARQPFWQEIDDALTAIVWELSQWRPVYGSLRFRRFAIAQVVRRLDLDLMAPADEQRQAVINALTRHRRVDKLRKVLQDSAALALGRVPGPLGWSLRTFVPWAVQLVFVWLLPRQVGRRMLLGRYQSWYRNQWSGDDIDVLIDLNRSTRDDANTDFRQKATQLMFAAFFADLQDDFQRGRRCGEWSLNSVLFLENVATECASTFLAELLTARKEHRDEFSGADPLTMVATSRSRVPVTTTEVTRILLRPLDLKTVRTMAEGQRWAKGKSPNIRRLAAQLHGFTGGHPEAVELLLKAAVEYGSANVELNDLLPWRPEPAAGGTPPDRSEALLQRLLPMALEDPVSDKEDLVTLSAARARDQAVALARRTKLLSGLWDPSELGSEMWVSGNAGGQLLRRLLVRCLAAREPDHPADWLTVHGALRRLYREAARRDDATKQEKQENTAGELYHALAIGDLQFVVAELADQAAKMATSQWLELLHSVTATPGRRGRDSRPPDERADQLASTVTAPKEEVAALAGVVAGLWIAADPVEPGNRRHLHQRIAKNYEGMANLVRSPAMIDDEAKNHREVARECR